MFTFWDWAGWLDTQQIGSIGEGERRCDTVGRFKRIDDSHGPVAVVIEFQTRPQGTIHERQAGYCFNIRREIPYQVEPMIRYDVVGVVIHLTGPDQPDQWGMTPPDFCELGLRQRLLVRSLREEDGNALLDQVANQDHHRCTLAWFPLMRGGDQPDAIERWVKLASQEPDSRLRSDYGRIATIFAELAGRSKIWQPYLKEWNMERSLVAESWVEEGRLKGLKEGRSEGLKEGRSEALKRFQQTVLAVVTSRFPGGVPVEIRQKIENETSFDTLQSWITQMLSADTPEAIRKLFFPQ